SVLRPDDPDQAGMPVPAPGENPGLLHIDNARTAPLGPQSKTGTQLGRHIAPTDEREGHGIRPVLNGCLY
ncbi:MAG TPA: hypothetical protein PLI13_03330, partial [Paracoccus sp. (in: a-proteobacteria)]|nr:hypothetical protein [Paracoccus sp. (in: a-proteobacteria)]